MISVPSRLAASSEQQVRSPASSVRLLVISGVDISKPITRNQAKPTPDYVTLVDTLQPDIVDMHNIQSSMTPLLKLVKRLMGLQWSIALAAFRERHKYDVIVATGEDVGLPLAVLLKLLRARIPLIVICHNLFSRRPAILLGRLKAGSVVEQFLCLSESQAHALQQRFGITADQVQLLYYQVDHRFFHPMPEVVVQNQICSVGLASRDYATLNEATRSLNIDVKIVAGSAWFNEAMNIAPDQLHEHAILCDADTSPELRQLYAESLFVVVPLRDVPRCVGFTAILEAMAMGKAVIVSKVQQFDDFVIDGWNGFHVPPGDPEALRERITYLLTHPEEARRLGQNARMTVEERFTLEHYVERVQNAVERATRP